MNSKKRPSICVCRKYFNG